MHTTIVTTDTLAAYLNHPDWVVVDLRSSLADPAYGRASYLAGHIPGAVYADLNQDLSDPPGGGRGRHPLPPLEAFAERAGALGISRSTQVVVYDDADSMYAARLWWMLRWAGHDAVAVLDGGFAKWTAEGREVRSGDEWRAPATFAPSPRADALVSADDVERMRSDADRRLIDSRSPDRFRGENETIDPVAGHIPGARNYFFKNNMDESGAFRTAKDLRSRLLERLDGVEPSQAVFYCGSGVTACHNLLAMEIAGLSGARLYAGSWSEWISDPERPIATGEDG